MEEQSRINAFLDFLQPQIEQEIHVGPWLTIDQQRIDQFAQITGDQQWIHTDPERAEKESPYGSTIAHGYLTLSLLPHLTESNHPDFFQKNYPGMKYRVNYGLNRVRFPTPVKVGAKIRARTTIQAAEKIKNAVQICYLITVEIAGEDKPACSAEFLARLYA
ncbi:MAG: MaoC family dehydratase [Deltaproteobacteria bacterium]|jgi:acyl dehydratase|nr:MaoC family dehydratase [Deltaproteobacteria bacterium]MCW9050185.1 MaoC family dehydratase [Deltaproteobacteria bacterium]